MENVLGRGKNKSKGPELGSARKFVQIEQSGPGEGRLSDELR